MGRGDEHLRLQTEFGRPEKTPIEGFGWRGRWTHQKKYAL